MRAIFWRAVLCAGFVGLPAAVKAADQAARPVPTVLVVVGAPGEAEFEQDFKSQVEAWRATSAAAGAKLVVIGDGSEPAPGDHERLARAFAEEPREGGEFWVVLIGHGTFDGREAKLNLRGPDVSATEFSEWLKPFQRRLAIIDTTSSSAPFLIKLSAPGRAIVTSTRSGYQQNYARFGKFLAEALGDPKSDLDKDGQISLLESFLSASHRTAEFYKTEGRLATEHALLDDNGDGLGTPADWFRGVRATKRARDGAELDGERAHQLHLVLSAEEQRLSPEMRERRDRLELRVGELRDQKEKLPEGTYLRELEKILLELASLYEGT